MIKEIIAKHINYFRGQVSKYNERIENLKNVDLYQMAEDNYMNIEACRKSLNIDKSFYQAKIRQLKDMIKDMRSIENHIENLKEK